MDIWSPSVALLPAMVPLGSNTANTDGGGIRCHLGFTRDFVALTVKSAEEFGTPHSSHGGVQCVGSWRDKQLLWGVLIFTPPIPRMPSRMET